MRWTLHPTRIQRIISDETHNGWVGLSHSSENCFDGGFEGDAVEGEGFVADAEGVTDGWRVEVCCAFRVGEAGASSEAEAGGGFEDECAYGFGVFASAALDVDAGEFGIEPIFAFKESVPAVLLVGAMGGESVGEVGAVHEAFVKIGFILGEVMVCFGGGIAEVRRGEPNRRR